MKKDYIKPSLLAYQIKIESLLGGESGGELDSGDAKANTDFSWDDLDDDSNNTADNDNSSFWD